MALEMPTGQLPFLLGPAHGALGAHGPAAGAWPGAGAWLWSAIACCHLASTSMELFSIIILLRCKLNLKKKKKLSKRKVCLKKFVRVAEYYL